MNRQQATRHAILGFNAEARCRMHQQFGAWHARDAARSVMAAAIDSGIGSSVKSMYTSCVFDVKVILSVLRKLF
jgi:hypothetical protein